MKLPLYFSQIWILRKHVYWEYGKALNEVYAAQTEDKKN
jgi:hypothetical protein